MRRIDQFSSLVMVVDESFLMRKWMEVVLGREGLRVESYEDPFAALRALALPNAEMPIFTFLEMHFQNSVIKSGLEVLQTLRSKAELQQMPVVMISADDRVFLARLLARLAGANDYLTKPLTEEAVVEAFWKHVRT